MRSPRALGAALLVAAAASGLAPPAFCQEYSTPPDPEGPPKPARGYLDSERPPTPMVEEGDKKPPKPGTLWTDISDPPAGTRQYWFGVRYRGTVVPKFLLNLLVDGGTTVFSNSAGVELEIRKDGRSIIPHLSFADYGMDDTIFMAQGKDPSRVNDHFLVNSGLKAVFAGADFLWSKRLSPMVELEYGLGFGVGVLFGDVVVNWVYADPNGPLTGLAEQRLSACQTTGKFGCNAIDHSNSSVTRVGRYIEPNWAGGGAVPLLYARLTLPIVGLRIRPIRDLELRPQVGLSLTEGFFFGVSASYLIPTS